MDPNECLKVLRAVAARILRSEVGKETSALAHDAETLAEHVQALDEWMKNGGFMPDAWAVKRGGER